MSLQADISMILPPDIVFSNTMNLQSSDFAGNRRELSSGDEDGMSAVHWSAFYGHLDALRCVAGRGSVWNGLLRCENRLA